MNNKNALFQPPRKSVFSSLYKGVLWFSILFSLCLSLSAYWLKIQLTELDNRQKNLATLEYQLSNVEMYLFESLLDGPRNGVKSLYLLQSEVYFINEQIQALSNINPADYRQLLAFFEGLHSVPEEHVFSLSKIQQETFVSVLAELKELHVALMQASVKMKADREVFEQYGVYLTACIALLFLVLTLLFSLMIRRRIKAGLHTIHYRLGKNHYAQNAAAPQYFDEFSDIADAIAKCSQENEKAQLCLKKQKDLLKHYFHLNESIELLVDEQGEVELASAGFLSLWNEQKNVLIEKLEMDSSRDELIGQVIGDVVLFSESVIKLEINHIEYVISVKPLVGDGTDHVVLTLVAEPMAAELEVLRNSLILMTKGVWGYPIRVTEGTSCYAFAVALEELRTQILSLVEALNSEYKSQENYEETTKLQQIATYIRAQNINNESHVQGALSSKVVVPSVGADHALGMSFLTFSKEIQSGVLLGYETVIQKLDLLGKDLAAEESMLASVEQWLQEVMAGVLFGLSSAHDESLQVRRRIAKDLAHDVQTVTDQIEQIKQRISSSLMFVDADITVSYSRLESARSNVENMLKEIAELPEGTEYLKHDALEDTKNIDNKGVS